MKRVLITSAIPYVAGVKHLGNLVGSMLPADIFARFCRSRGYDTLAICATDEHGAPVELAALEEGTPVADYAAKWHAVQKELGDRFALAWDNFGRSSSPQNHELTLHFARALWKNGWLELRTTKQAYSPTDGRFLPDRYVIGTCPHCGYDRARGDQCENCTRVLDPVDLINPRSAVSGAQDIEIRDSTHLFLKQSQFADRLARLDRQPQGRLAAAGDVDRLQMAGRGPAGPRHHPRPGMGHSGARRHCRRQAEGQGLLRLVRRADRIHRRDQGMGRQERTRAMPGKTGGTARRPRTSPIGNSWARTMCLSIPSAFPVTIMASGEPWKLVDRLKGFNWLNYDGGKFSTSGKRGIFMDTALEVAPADWWRYYLIANAPEGSDSNFTWEHFAGVINKDLADVLGNFVNRVTKFCVARFDGQVPGEGEYGEDEHALIAEMDRRIAQYAAFMEDAEFRKALAELRAIWVAGNEYMTTRRALDPYQDRPRQGGGGRAHGAEPGPPVRASDLAGDAVIRPDDS